MFSTRRLFCCLSIVTLASVLFICQNRSVLGYVEAPHSLGQVISLSTHIMVVRVEQVDKTKNLIIYRKVRDLKGKHPTDIIRHNIGRGGFNAREWQYTMEWAEVGKTAVFFHNGGASETCIGTYWYQAYAGGEWWNLSHGEPFLLRSYAGSVEKLAAAVSDIVAGREVIVPCMVDGNKNDLHLRRARIQRVKASLKLDYNPKRDFVGWGGEDFRRLQGMPGFSHYSAVARVDPDAQATSIVDINGDGKADLCLAGPSRVALLQNGGESLNEVSLPGASGCRAAVWADYNADGKPDLLLATLTGPKLYTNLGGTFRDDTHLLPAEPGYNLTAAAWLDYDGDGRPDLLLGNGFHGLRLYRNLGEVKARKWFENIFEGTGLGLDGIGGTVKGDTLTVCDVNGDGRPDFLYGAGSSLLALNTGKGFIAAKDCGIAYRAGKVGPVFGDYDNDGRPDLFVPQANGCKLFHNDGGGRFSDVTDKTGLKSLTSRATCAAWGDMDNDGNLDLMVGCLRGPNRFFRNKGDGTFEDATDAIGLGQRIFNTQAVALVDLNNDGVLDVVFNNEGQESCVLLGNREFAAKRTPVTLHVKSKTGVIGSRVEVHDKDGKLQGTSYISGGDGRGGQAVPAARFALRPGKYRVEVLLSNGQRRGKEIVVAASHLLGVVE
ncbi:MAG TPA: VCBS repeat-containing protein [Gemmataceae bacterium]|nr:VCBS repeat-containing protein [Gemmataceae bacterium]